MAPLRHRATRIQNDQDQIFEGLPIRHWHKIESSIGTTPEDRAIAGRSPWPELPMPRDSQLLSEMSRQMLRIARTPQFPKAPQQAEDEEKDRGEEDETKDSHNGFSLKRWVPMPKSHDEPEREYLAKRRKGLPPMLQPEQPRQYRSLKVRRFDADGTPHVYDVMAPVGQVVEGEIFEADERGAPVPVEPPAAPGTVIEGVGVVNQDGVVVAQPATPRRKPPPPRRKPKKGGPGRSKKKIVPELGPDGEPLITDASAAGVAAAAAAAASDAADSGPNAENEDTPMADAQDGDEEDDEEEGSGEEGDEMDEDEDGHEEGENSTPTLATEDVAAPADLEPTSIPLVELESVPKEEIEQPPTEQATFSNAFPPELPLVPTELRESPIIPTMAVDATVEQDIPEPMEIDTKEVLPIPPVGPISVAHPIEHVVASVIPPIPSESLPELPSEPQDPIIDPNELPMDISVTPLESEPIVAIGTVPQEQQELESTTVPEDTSMPNAEAADSAPIDTIPAELALTEVIAAGRASAEVAPLGAIPVEATPAEPAPAESTSVEVEPIAVQPVQVTPVEAILAEALSIEAVPIESIPIESAPVEPASVEPALAESTPVEDSIKAEATSGDGESKGNDQVEGAGLLGSHEEQLDNAKPAAQEATVDAPPENTEDEQPPEKEPKVE